MQFLTNPLKNISMNVLEIENSQKMSWPPQMISYNTVNKCLNKYGKLLLMSWSLKMIGKDNNTQKCELMA